MLVYGVMVVIEISYVVVIIIKVVFFWSLGFKGEIMVLCFFVFKYNRVRIEVFISIVWIGYIIWYIVELSRNFLFKSLVKFRGMLNMFVLRFVMVKLRMKNLFGFCFFCKYIVMYIRRFFNEFIKEIVIYRESCIICVILFLIFVMFIELFVLLFKFMVEYFYEFRWKV